MKIFNSIVKFIFLLALVYLICKVPDKVASTIEFCFGWIFVKIQGLITSKIAPTI